MFAYKGVPQDRQVPLVATKLCGYANIWWTDFLQQQFSRGLHSVEAWRDMKEAMTFKFIPLNFHRGMFYKLHSFKQGSESVDEYAREFHKLSPRSRIEELDQQMIARCINGFRDDIR